MYKRNSNHLKPAGQESGLPVRLKRMVRLPIVGRPPNREILEKATACGIEARPPVVFAEGFAGRAGAPGENLGKADRESQREGDTLYLKVCCGSGCGFGAK